MRTETEVTLTELRQSMVLLRGHLCPGLSDGAPRKPKQAD